MCDSLDCASTHSTDGDEHVSTPWRALRVAGTLDFALTGILASLTAPLAAAEISVFALSSFDTDYILVRSDSLAAAIECLQKAGYPVTTP